MTNKAASATAPKIVCAIVTPLATFSAFCAAPLTFQCFSQQKTSPAEEGESLLVCVEQLINFVF
jgi:hypothetical protein